MSKVYLPLAVQISTNKKFILNLNNYRNTHYILLNKAKIKYKEEIYPQLEKLPVYTRVNLVYTWYPSSNRRGDLANVASVHDKFFSDALVECNKLPDDSFIYIDTVIYKFGNIDKENPRVEVEILNID